MSGRRPDCFVAVRWLPEQAAILQYTRGNFDAPEHDS